MIITGFYWVFLYFYRIRTEFLHGFPLLPSLLRFSMNITEFLPSFFWGALLVSGMSLRVGHDEEPSLLMPLVDSSVPSGSSLCVCVCVCVAFCLENFVGPLSCCLFSVRRVRPLGLWVFVS